MREICQIMANPPTTSHKALCSRGLFTRTTFAPALGFAHTGRQPKCSGERIEIFVR